MMNESENLSRGWAETTHLHDKQRMVSLLAARRGLVVIMVGWMIYLSGAASAQPSSTTDAARILQNAINDYSAALDAVDRDKRLNLFQRAEVQFEQAIEASRVENADLYVNLGNAALGAQHLGPAIVAYRRALQIDPANRKAEQNLMYARSLLPDWVPRPESADGNFDSLLTSLTKRSRDDLLQAASIVFVIAAVCFAISIRFQRVGFRNLSILFMTCWCGLLALAFLDERSMQGMMAVVTIPDTVARSADSVNAPPRFAEPLPSGAEVEIVEDRDQWLRVRIQDGRDAWVPSSSVDRF
ncbi:MAG: hypothetical protein R3C05_11430 [Pirellulaceae bacterium]